MWLSQVPDASTVGRGLSHLQILFPQHLQHGRDDLGAMHSKPGGPLSPPLRHAARVQLPSLLLHGNSKLFLKLCQCWEVSAVLLSGVRATRSGVTACPQLGCEVW